MTIDKEKVFHSVDDWIYSKYGNHILTDDGRININAVVEIAKQQDTKVVEVEPEDIVDDASGVIQVDEEDIRLIFNEKEFIMYVPKQLREKIQFEIEYILSGFDKVQNAVADITKEFQLNRKGEIVNAEKELRNCDYEFTKDSRQIILGCVNDVGSAIEQIKESIIAVCDRVDAIPKDRKRRLFKTPINKILGDVRVGRVSIYDYIYGSAVYAELNMKIGRKNAAVDRLQGTIDFLSSMKNQGKFKRVEQWNEKKDLFWESGIDEQISILKEQLLKIKNYDGKITI